MLLVRVAVIPTVAGATLLAGSAAEAVGHDARPARRAATEERIRQLEVPDGFTVSVVAHGLGVRA